MNIQLSVSTVSSDVVQTSQFSPRERKCRSWKHFSFVGNSWWFVSEPQSFSASLNNLSFFHRSRCCRRWPVLKPENRWLHMTSVSVVCTHRLPLIHLKNFVVLYVYTVYQVNFGNLWCLTLYRTRISACTAAHWKIFFNLVLTWEHFVSFLLCFYLFFCI